MCGIWMAWNRAMTQDAALAYIRALEARGPEYTSTTPIPGTNVILGFTRLAINGLTPAGNQPFEFNTTHTICNGEIYNYQDLATRWAMDLPDNTSDCAVIPRLMAKLPMTDVFRTLDGVFAVAHVDPATDTLLVARDPYGVRPLFEAQYTDGSNVWSSEIKAIPTGYTSVVPFPPGSYSHYSLSTGILIRHVKYHTIPHVKLAGFSSPNHAVFAKEALRESLLAAVKKRLLSDRPIGALLSGGLDSSLVAAILAQELRKTHQTLTTFSIGMPGSTDLRYAKQVATYIKSNHYEIVVSPDDFLAAIPQVVKDIESYDITTVRASVGNWLLGKYIKEHTDIKVVFNGDGSDEVGGGYLYFYAAPSDEEFEAESERLLQDICMFDVLRSDRCMAAHGLEARTPFLDKNVVATWRAIATTYRRPTKANADGRGARMEKSILREAFDKDHLLPAEVLWRKKEAFSDGVSAITDSWYVRAANYATNKALSKDYIHNPPTTAEAQWYRDLFVQTYGTDAAKVIPYMWLPRWVPGATDPSARTLKELYST
jgi:asparagine synthase (glutamine-hydrolysing)